MSTIFFFLEVKSRIKFNSDTNAPISRISTFFSNQIGCCNYKGGKESPGDKVTCFVQAIEIRSRRTDLTGDTYLSISLRREFECQFYDHSSNRCERFARVKVKHEGACATSFTVVTRVIVHAKRSASKIWMS